MPCTVANYPCNLQLSGGIIFIKVPGVFYYNHVWLHTVMYEWISRTLALLRVDNLISGIHKQLFVKTVCAYASNCVSC